MNKIWLILQREYLTRVKKKTFILVTFLAPLGFALLFIIPLWISKATKEEKRIVVKDASGLISVLPDAEDKTMRFTFMNDMDHEQLKGTYKELDFDGYLYIAPSFSIERTDSIYLFTARQFGLTAKATIENLIEKKIETMRIDKAGYDREVIDNLRPRISLVDRVETVEGEERSGNSTLATVMGYMMGFAIYMVLFIYGTMVMKGVMEEKTNRIVEVMASSVRPFQLMLGKVLGIGAVGLTQFALWIGLTIGLNFLLTLYLGPELMDPDAMAASQMGGGPSPDEIEYQMAKIMTEMQEVSWTPIILTFLFYFFGGYLFYGALFAAIGSAANDDGDVQSLTFPVTVPIIISIFIMMATIEQPDNALGVWASIIPFSSPIVMPARIPFDVPTWQIIVSAVSLILGFLGTTWLAGRIYRIGILLYGKKVTVKEIGRWLISGQ